jgi:hypothetical protein
MLANDIAANACGSNRVHGTGTSHSSHAMGNRLFLGADFPETPDAPAGLPRRDVQERDCLPVASRRQTGLIPGLTHSRHPGYPLTRHDAVANRSISTPFVTGCRGRGRVGTEGG